MDMIGDVGHVVKCVLVTTMVKVCDSCRVRCEVLALSGVHVVGWQLPNEVYMKLVNCFKY